MKKILTLLFLGMCTYSHAQYFQRYYNLDFVTPKYRNEVTNSGIRTVLNYGGLPTNNFICGVGTSYLNTRLAAPDNRAHRLRFIKNNRDGSAVVQNFGYEFLDTLMRPMNSTGNSIAEIDNDQGTGGFIAVGAVGSNVRTKAVASGGSDASFVNLTSTGTVASAISLDFGGTGDTAWCVRRSVFMKGTYIVCGHSYDPVTRNVNCFVARLDVAGTIIWAFSYNFDLTTQEGVSAICRARQLCEDPKTGRIYVVGTHQDKSTAINVNGLAFALTPGGAVLWSRMYNLGGIDEFKAIRFTNDENLIVDGHSNYKPSTTAPAMTNMLLVKLRAADGVIIFQSLLRATGGSTAVQYNSKAFDVLEVVTAAGGPTYYLVGPAYTPGLPTQLMYRTNAAGIGITNYKYNKMHTDSLFGIDIDTGTVGRGLALFSNIRDRDTALGDGHIMKTTFAGATCTNYCPADPPITIQIQMGHPKIPFFIKQEVRKLKMGYRIFKYNSVLQCNQRAVNCGTPTIAPPPVPEITASGLKALIFPNPAKGILNVQLTGLSAGRYSMVIRDITGRTVTSKVLPVDNGRAQIDVSRLARGNYMLTVEHKGKIKPVSFIKD